MRLIDADTIKIPSTHVDIFENCRNCRLLDESEVKQIIDDAPTVDAVARSEFDKVCRERDILIDVAKNHYPACKYCKYGRTNCTEFPCADCLQGDRWEWRGVDETN